MPFLGSWEHKLHNVAWAEAHLRTKWHLNPTSHLATTDMGQKLAAVHASLREAARVLI